MRQIQVGDTVTIINAKTVKHFEKYLRGKVEKIESYDPAPERIIYFAEVARLAEEYMQTHANAPKVYTVHVADKIYGEFVTMRLNQEIHLFTSLVEEEEEDSEA